MSNLYNDGQMSATPASSLLAAASPAQERVVDGIFSNTSGASTETVIVTVTRNSGSNRQVLKETIAPNETLVITGLALGPNDVLLGSTTDGATVDFSIVPSRSNMFDIFVLASDGSLKTKQSLTGAITGSLTITDSTSTSLVVGRQGATNPGFQVDDSAATCVDGWKVKANATGTPAALSVISSASNESGKIDALGSGQVVIGGTSTGLVKIGQASASYPTYNTTKTAIASQNGTPTAAQMLGGYINHNSNTGAGTLTFPTSASIDTALAGTGGIAAINGDTFSFWYVNSGNQTVTLTANGDATQTLIGTVAVPTHRAALVTFVRTGAATYDVFAALSA